MGHGSKCVVDRNCRKFKSDSLDDLMSDLCWMEIRCREADCYQFEAIGFVLEECDDGVARMVDEDAEWGHYDDIQEVVNAGIPFVGWHSSGAAYGYRRVAAHAGKFLGFNSDVDGNICIIMRQDGNLINMDGALKFLELERAAEVEIKENTADATSNPAAGESNATCPRCGGAAVRLFTTITCLKGCE